MKMMHIEILRGGYIHICFDRICDCEEDELYANESR